MSLHLISALPKEIGNPQILPTQQYLFEFTQGNNLVLRCVEMFLVACLRLRYCIKLITS